MGALLAFQPAAKASADRFDAARAWIERAKGLKPAACGAHVAKFQRRNGTGVATAVGDRGFVASAGNWRHPAIPGDDNAALLARLSADGARVLDGLDGCFALLWHDTKTGTLTAVPDHLGRIRLYAVEAPEGVYLGTSPVALARAAKKGVDPVAAWELLSTGVIYEERSPFQGVRRLVGGRTYRFVGGRAAGEDAAAFLPPRDSGPHADVQAVAAACRAAIAEWTGGGARPLADLTGGLDSRLVVGLLLDANVRFEVTVTGDADDPDVRVAQALARALGLRLRHVPRGQARGSFAAVLDAAARVEGTYDASEYAAIAAVHGGHLALADLSVNGSGGEVFRNYWWDARHIGRREGDAAGELVRRFTASALPPPFLAEPRDPAAHFRAVLERTLAGRAGDPLPALFDHAYLHLRMCCWQGAIASATNELWQGLSPLLLRRPLETLYRLPDRERLGHGLMYALFLSFPKPIHTIPLTTGFPPLLPNARNLWRFVPGLLKTPAEALRRARGRFRRGRPDLEAGGAVGALMASGARDFLRSREMALRPLLDDARLEAFLARPSFPLLGRLLALEWAAREAR